MVKKYISNPLCLSVFITVIFVYSHFSYIPVKNQFISIIPKSEICLINGIIESSPSKCSSGKYYSAILSATSCASDLLSSEAEGKIRVYLPTDYIESFFPGRLYSKAKASNIVETGSNVFLSGKFSDSVFFCDRVISSNLEYKGNSFFRILRAKGRLKFKRMMYSWGDAGGLLLALLSGAREYTEKSVSDNFRLAGLSHVLALSGMHLSMFSGLALFLGARLGRKKIALILQLSAIICFVWFAGFSPSLLRAFICVSVIMLQGILNIEKSDMLTVLCFSFFVQTVISPNDLCDTGFILSYGALLGILITGSFFRKVYGFVMPLKLASSFSASTSAQLVTMPVSAKLFGMITPVGIVSSVCVSPFITVFIYSGLFFIILGLILSPFERMGEFFMKIQYNLIKNMVDVFGKVPPVIF